jgi:hypothetical protein
MRLQNSHIELSIMEKPRSISSGEAMRWNEDVERRRKEYHEQRCAENALYRRAYERLQEQRRHLQETISKSMVQLADAMNADCQQRVNSVMDNVEQQPVKTHEEVMRNHALMDSVCKCSSEAMAHFTGFGFGFAVAAMMLVDGKRMNQRIMELAEERPYLEEIRRIDEEFDKEIIRLSGFEW